MKNTILFIALIVLISACSKPNNTATPINQNPYTLYAYNHWIPNWDNKTLVGNLYDSSHTYFVATDTMYSKHNGDTSYVIYHGTKYYLWTVSYGTINKDEFEKNKSGYANCALGTRPFDTSSIVSFNLFNNVVPSKYFDADYGKWHDQSQYLNIDLAPPFPENLYLGLWGEQ